jgi:hypothetical protein
MRHPLPLLCLTAALAGCGARAPDVAAEAEALAQQGKLEEAAARVDLTCAYAPASGPTPQAPSEPCRASDRRAAELRIQAAEKAMGEGRFAKAERLLARALATADGPTAERAAQRLAADDLTQGLAYERALAGSDKREARKAMEAIAATKTPVAAQATAWLARELPALLVAAVNAACGPAREGSCSHAAVALRAAKLPGPEAAAALALAEDEQRRVYPLLVTSETFLKGFATAKERSDLIALCASFSNESGPAALETCMQGGLAPGSVPTAADEDERRQKRTANLTLWRKTMRSISDPMLVHALDERLVKADTRGEFTPMDFPKPPKAPGGRK